MNLENEDDNIKLTENDLPQQFVLKLLGQHEAKGLWGIKHTREPVDIMVQYAKTHDLSLAIVQMVITKEGIFMSPLQCNLEKSMYGKETAKKLVEGTNLHGKVNETWNDVKGPLIKQNQSPYSLVKLIENRRNLEAPNFQNPKKEKNFCFIKKDHKKKAIGPVTDIALLDKYNRFDWRKAGVFFFGIDTISYGVQDLIFTRVFSMIVVNDDRNRTSTHKRNPFTCHAFVCESRNTARRVTYALAAAFQAYGRSMKYIKESMKVEKVQHREGKPRNFLLKLQPPFAAPSNDSEA